MTLGECYIPAVGDDVTVLFSDGPEKMRGTVVSVINDDTLLVRITSAGELAPHYDHVVGDEVTMTKFQGEPRYDEFFWSANAKPGNHMDFEKLDEVNRDFDWSKPSKGVIANGAHGGCVLFFAGPHLYSMVSDAGISDLDLLGLDDAPEGISIWEGGIKSVHINTPDCNEHDSWLDGSFRDPTDEEWAAIRRNECPWDEDAWLKKPEPANAK